MQFFDKCGVEDPRLRPSGDPREAHDYMSGASFLQRNRRRESWIGREGSVDQKDQAVAAESPATGQRYGEEWGRQDRISSGKPLQAEAGDVRNRDGGEESCACCPGVQAWGAKPSNADRPDKQGRAW